MIDSCQESGDGTRANYPAASGGAFPPGRNLGISEQPIFSSTLSLLVVDVLPDQVRGNMIPSRANIVPIGPQLPAPVRSAQAGKLLIQFSGCDTLQHIHHFRWGVARRTADKQVDMVNLYCQRFYLPCSPCADLSNQSVQPICHLFPQHLTAVPRYPDKVVRQSIDRVCASSRSHLDNYHSKTRSRAPLRGAHNADHLRRSTWAPAFGGGFHE